MTLLAAFGAPLQMEPVWGAAATSLSEVTLATNVPDPAGGPEQEQHLALWADLRDGYNLMGTRLDAAGKPLDRGGLLLDRRRGGPPSSRAAGCYGTWHIANATNTDGVQLLRLDLTGKVLDRVPFPGSLPSMACLGPVALVAWEAGGMIRVARLSRDGALDPPAGFVVSASDEQGQQTQAQQSPVNERGSNPMVASDGRQWLVVYQVTNTSATQLRGIRLDAEGRRVDGRPFLIPGATQPGAWRLLSYPGAFGIVMRSGNGATLSTVSIRGKEPPALQEPIPLDDSHWWILDHRWTGNRRWLALSTPPASAYMVGYSRVEAVALGELLPTGPKPIGGPIWKSAPDAGGFLKTPLLLPQNHRTATLIWANGTGPNHEHRAELLARRVSLVGTRSRPEDPYPIATSASRQTDVELALDPEGNALLAWIDTVGIEHPRPAFARAQASSEGVIELRDPRGVTLRSTPLPAQKVAVAAGGGQFLLVWEEAVSGHRDVLGVRIDPRRGLLDPKPLALSTSGDAGWPAVTWVRGRWLVVWGEETRIQTRRFPLLVGRSVAPDGTVAEIASYRAEQGRDIVEPTMACGGERCMVVWGTDRFAAGSQLHGALFDAAAGTWDEGRHRAGGDNKSLMDRLPAGGHPHLANGPEDLLLTFVAVRHHSGNAPPAVVGQRIDTTGEPVSAAMLLAESAPHATHPRGAWTGSGYRVVWTTGLGPLEYDPFATQWAQEQSGKVKARGTLGQGARATLGWSAATGRVTAWDEYDEPVGARRVNVHAE